MKIRTDGLSGKVSSGSMGPVFPNGTEKLELSCHHRHLVSRSPQAPPFPTVPPSLHQGVSRCSQLPMLTETWASVPKGRQRAANF